MNHELILGIILVSPCIINAILQVRLSWKMAS